MEINYSLPQILENYKPKLCIKLFNGAGLEILKMFEDGRIEFGPAFTTLDQASLEFWDIVKNVKSHVVRKEQEEIKPEHEHTFQGENCTCGLPREREIRRMQRRAMAAQHAKTGDDA